MKIGIIYTSKTGMTRKLAEAAARRLESLSHEVTIMPLEKYAGESGFDALLIGSYCDSNNYPKDMRKLLEAAKLNDRLASFVTHATYESGKYYENWAKGCETYFTRYCEERKIANLGYFHCRSKPSVAIGIFVRMAVIKDRDDWKKYKKDMNDYPGTVELERFGEFIDSVNERLVRPPETAL